MTSQQGMGSQQYVCRYCRQPSDPSARTCPLCGAPVDIRASVSMSGWTKQPAIRDMAHIQFGQSRCQIEGTMVPVADFALASGEWIYFSHKNLLWADPGAQLSNMGLKGGWKRMMAGLPLVMLVGQGPGRIALSDNHAGDIVVLPLQHGQSMWVREHRFLVATGNVAYDWTSTGIWYDTRKGDERERHWPMGQFGDVFSAQNGPGLLLLHAPGNTFVRDLAPGEPLLIQPSALLYRDVTVQAHLHLEYPRNLNGRGLASLFGNRYSNRSIWARLVGPGRVAVQSVYERPEDALPIARHSRATSRNW
ncbi:AIM24 family protein [Actinomadura rupiterrae]|uniref:AIM24 family protein n=1 Tax=Actinomadura rupiterrae TaxID=559627 RepID=UPI0020A2B9D5|nr:AIM24 family protein [Actinomadura rupiterrae]MCP2341814.1 uncharacterized protein (AIM24 family) [Actinomadura rupiterrae]